MAARLISALELARWHQDIYNDLTAHVQRHAPHLLVKWEEHITAWEEARKKSLINKRVKLPLCLFELSYTCMCLFVSFWSLLIISFPQFSP
jgi:hypothetical protein